MVMLRRARYTSPDLCARISHSQYLQHEGETEEEKKARKKAKKAAKEAAAGEAETEGKKKRRKSEA